MFNETTTNAARDCMVQIHPPQSYIYIYTDPHNSARQLIFNSFKEEI